MDTLLEHFGYVAMFAMLVGGGAGLPLPEEAVEIGAGVLAHQGVLDVRKVMMRRRAGGRLTSRGAL
jgi:membrane protein DedA with SNARE-associated domain